jgi:predicted nucleic acid-binding protein
VSYLLDTNVISELRRKRPHPGVAQWFGSVDGDELYLSVLVLGEIVQGVERLRRKDPVRAGGFDAWLDALRVQFSDRLVPVDAAVAEEWGRLNAGDPLPAVDGLLAATARVRGWTLVTRNGADVQRTGVRLLDPFAI